jgi:predicted  nucleic acid-binding Zn-ribbon protein
MSQIDDLQARITAALDRISRGLEAQNADGGAAAAELEALRVALDEEKTVSAQWEERVKRLKEKLEEAETRAENARDEARASLRKLDTQLQSLRRANAQLRENNKALREANEAGVAEPHLINKAMLAELEGLRAARSADRAESDAIMAELTRLIEGTDDEREGA